MLAILIILLQTIKKMMENIKRFSGILWIGCALGAIYLLITQASREFAQSPALDTRIFWFTIIPVFLPIALGLLLFGWYCFKGEYAGDRV
jgi:L-cystine uptake protein TcyP (sodium:dicarboxylate symporter family)